MPTFLSSLTETDFSWLQKRQLKEVGSGSDYRDGKAMLAVNIWPCREAMWMCVCVCVCAVQTHSLWAHGLAGALLALAHCRDVSRSTDLREDGAKK